jgi:hypothetical protein
VTTNQRERPFSLNNPVDFTTTAMDSQWIALKPGVFLFV